MKPLLAFHMMQSVYGRIDSDIVGKVSGDEHYTSLKALDCSAVVGGGKI